VGGGAGTSQNLSSAVNLSAVISARPFYFRGPKDRPHLTARVEKLTDLKSSCLRLLDFRVPSLGNCYSVNSLGSTGYDSFSTQPCDDIRLNHAPIVTN